MLLDSLVILTYFAVIISIGLYKGRGDKTMEGFAVGDRNIPWWAVLASILAAEVSAATFLGAPGEGYEYRNFFYAQLAIGTILARVLVSIIFIKPYYDYRVISIYDFLRVRFGETTKNGASIVFLITRALASGTRLYVAAIVLVLGWENLYHVHALPLQAVWIYVGALFILTAFTAVYTALGGIKAVVWTDLIQATPHVRRARLRHLQPSPSHPGRMGHSHPAHPRASSPIPPTRQRRPRRRARQCPGHRRPRPRILEHRHHPRRSASGQNIRNVLETEYTVWAAFVASTFTTMATHGTDQDMVQRMLTAKDYVRSRLSLVLSGLIDLPLALCFLTVGILLWAFYQTPGMENPFAYYIVNQLPPGIRGILVAGLFATAMGSLSTALNALATSFTEDWYMPYINPGATPARVVRAARISTVFFSILLVAIGAFTAYSVLILHLRIIPIVLGIFGYTYGSLLGVFLAGMLTKSRGNNTGNIIAMIVGFIAVCHPQRPSQHPLGNHPRQSRRHPLETRMAPRDRLPMAHRLRQRHHLLHRHPFPHFARPAGNRPSSRRQRPPVICDHLMKRIATLSNCDHLPTPGLLDCAKWR